MQTFEALAIEGKPEFLRGFVAGWSAGRGLSADELGRRIRWLRDWRARVVVWAEGFLAALRGGHPTQLLVRDDVAGDFAAALAAQEPELRLRARGRVTEASFAFEFEIFARDEAAVVRALFEPPPAGVAVDDWECKETAAADAAGIELMAPAHDYACRGRGTVRGAVMEVLVLHERTRSHERIRAHDVTLALAP